MPLSRRHFFYGTALAATACSSWFIHRQLNRMPTLTVNRPGLALGHALRDGQLPQTPAREHHCHTLILGSGMAALSAAWYLNKHGHRDVLIAEGPEADGNAATFHHGDLKAPTGAHYLALPSRESRQVREMLRDLGILQQGLDSADPQYRESDLVHAPAERLLYRGRWQDSLLPAEDADSQRFFALIRELKRAYGTDGRKIFAIPVALSSQDATWRALDSLTFAAWLDREGYRSESLRWYLDYCCRDDYGQGIAQVSAFAGLHYFAARGHDNEAVLTWPDGLGHLATRLRRHIGLQTLVALPQTASLRFSRIAALPASAIRIREEDNGVDVLLLSHPQHQVIRIRAQHVISAMPLAVAARITHRPERYGLAGLHLPSAPWLIGNFVLKRFPREKRHENIEHELAWDNVVHGSAGLGYVVASHQLIRVAKPEKTVFTTYTALNHEAPQIVRQWLLHTDDDSLLRIAAQDLLHAYGEPVWRNVEHVDLTIRGHGMSVPHPGYLQHPVLRAVQQHHSRLLFAHSDMSGYSVMEEALHWGVQAANKILSQNT
ncbi:MAG: NAD(P)-binding protein [Cardiobacteriaceae bacterium]|nr:NAD(P)-binding protein [Cardiobacteriaceae bacterium]